MGKLARFFDTTGVWAPTALSPEVKLNHLYCISIGLSALPGGSNRKMCTSRGFISKKTIFFHEGRAELNWNHGSRKAMKRREQCQDLTSIGAGLIKNGHFEKQFFFFYVFFVCPPRKGARILDHSFLRFFEVAVLDQINTDRGKALI